MFQVMGLMLALSVGTLAMFLVAIGRDYAHRNAESDSSRDRAAGGGPTLPSGQSSTSLQSRAPSRTSSLDLLIRTIGIVGCIFQIFYW